MRHGKVALLTAAIAALLLISGIFDRLFMGTNFAITSYDNDTGWFAIGIARLSGYPLTDFHHPSFLFNILSGAFVGLVNLDGTERPFVQYLQIAFATQVVIVIVAAYLIARMVHLGFFPFAAAWIATAMAASLPTAIVFSGHYSNYFILVLAALGVGLLIHAWLAGHEEMLVPLGGLLGITVANFFPVLPVLLTILMALFGVGFTREQESSPRPKFKEVIKRHRGLVLFAAATALAMSYRLPLVAPNPTAAIAGGLFCILLVVGGPAAMLWLGRHVEAIFPSIWRFWLALFAGWWLGALWLAPYYLTSFGWRLSEVYIALISEGILLQKLQESPIVWLGLLPFLALMLLLITLLIRRGSRNATVWMALLIYGLLAPAGIIAVYRLKLIAMPWLWLTLFPFIAFALLLPHFKDKSLSNIDRSHLMAAIIFALGTPLTLGVALLYGTSSPEPALALRLMVGVLVIAIVAVCYILTKLALPRPQVYVLSGIIISICAASLVTTLVAAKTAIDRNAAIGSAIDTQIAEFMAKVPDGIVLCARDEAYTRICSVAYAYNSYRSDESRAKLPTRWLYGRRVLWLSIDELELPLANYLNGFKGPILVVGARERILGSGNPTLMASMPETGDFVAYQIVVE